MDKPFLSAQKVHNKLTGKFASVVRGSEFDCSSLVCFKTWNLAKDISLQLPIILNERKDNSSSKSLIYNIPDVY
jgi:hypothetical protein